jgi:HlyD family secretion protein
MKKVLKSIVGILIAGSVIWTFWFLYKKSQKAPEIFQVVQAQKRTIIKKTIATGTVVPKNETEIRPRVSGIIDELYVIAGQTIRKGDKIAKIRIVPNMGDLNAAETRVKQAEIAFSNAKIDYDRQKELLQKGVSAKADFQKYELAYNQAKQELDASKNNLSIVRDGINKESALASNTIVCSTIEGMVLDVPVKVGFSVIETNEFNAGTTIATVADMSSIEFRGKADETEVGKIKIGMPLLLTVGAIDGVTFDAVLSYISPKGVLENGAIQFEIKANVKLRCDYFIRAGYSANADIVLDKKDSVLSIEEKNVIFENQKTFVEVRIDSTTFKKIPVTIGISDGIYTQVLSGLTDKDKVKVQK